MSWMRPTAAWIKRRGDQLVRAPAGDLEELMERALREGGGLVVLGAFGSGKTETARRLGARLGVPVVPLRLLARAADFDATLRALAGDAEAAILDGLDEIGPPDHMGAPAFFERVTSRFTRWVLSSRPGHIRTDLSEPDPGQVDCFHLPLVEILPYPIPPEAPAFTADHPVLLALYQAGARGETPRLLLESFLSGFPEVDALEALAWRAYDDRAASVESASFDARDLVGLPERLFVCDFDGRWRFGHRSLYDGLVARRLSRELAANQGQGPDAHTGRVLSGAMRSFLVGPFAGWSFDERWVLVPRGNFVSGGSRSADERPLVIKHLARPIQIARSAVTNGEFQRFLDIKGPRPRGAEFLAHWRGRRCPPALLDHPVMNLRPEDAEAYAAWVNARLPSADGWEKAVRGWDGRHFPWGDSFDPTRANTAESGREGTMPAMTFDQGSGLYGAIGDAFEYTSTSYRDRPDRGQVVMGGSYAHTALRASLRLSHTLSGRLKVGLRLERTHD